MVGFPGKMRENSHNPSLSWKNRLRQSPRVRLFPPAGDPGGQGPPGQVPSAEKGCPQPADGRCLRPGAGCPSPRENRGKRRKSWSKPEQKMAWSRDIPPIIPPVRVKTTAAPAPSCRCASPARTKANVPAKRSDNRRTPDSLRGSDMNAYKLME